MSNITAPYWTYIKGGSPLNPIKVYSNYYDYNSGTPNNKSHPGGRTYGVGWTDKDDNLFLFGGSGYADVSTPNSG